MTKSKSKLTSKSKLVVTKEFIIIACIALGLVVGYYALSNRQSAKVSTTQDPAVVAQRKARITAIYDSLKLGPDYKVTHEDIFGDKRPYSYDAGRSFSSSREYVHSASVSATVAQLRAAIEAAGFKYFEEPYPGSTFTELHFKSDKNEYVRLNVSSKPRDEAFQRDNNPTKADFALDPNAGPSNVTIKVNLDDNNE